MDRRLLDWARAVKARRPWAPPPLWLFTDPARGPDPEAAARRLPRRLCGVVVRHDADPDRGRIARRVAAVCRARGIVLVVAGDRRLAARLGAGLHLRDGRLAAAPRWMRRRGAFMTSSAHDGQSLRRALRAGADLVFLSPAFPTLSHPGAPALGPLRWARMAQRARGRAAALGGIDGRTIRRIPPGFCAAAGAIGALSA